MYRLSAWFIACFVIERKERHGPWHNVRLSEECSVLVRQKNGSTESHSHEHRTKEHIPVVLRYMYLAGHTRCAPMFAADQESGAGARKLDRTS